MVTGVLLADAQLGNTAAARHPGSADPIVQYQPKVRKVSAVPQKVPVVHSSAYLFRRKKPKDGERPAVLSSRDDSVDPVEQNAVEWALRQADAYFDTVEGDKDKKSPARVLVKNPATQLTMKTMQVGHYDCRLGYIVLASDACSVAHASHVDFCLLCACCSSVR